MKSAVVLAFVASALFFAGAVIAVTGPHAGKALIGFGFAAFFAVRGLNGLKARRATQATLANETDRR